MSRDARADAHLQAGERPAQRGLRLLSQPSHADHDHGRLSVLRDLELPRAIGYVDRHAPRSHGEAQARDVRGVPRGASVEGAGD